MLAASAEALTCPECGTTVAAALLTCPQCHWLVHTDRLNALARQADAAASTGNAAEAIATWQLAQALLPPGSRQHDAVSARIAALGREHVAAEAKTHTGSTNRGRWSLVGGAGALLVFMLTKGKFLFLGLTKSTTLFSMLASFAVYWTQWGMLFALGFVVSIYIHEMGHVAALRRYGIPASAPMFVPGIGAFVRMQQAPANRIEDARVGLAGPIWGLGAAAGCWALFMTTQHALWAAIGHVGAWINLFNLMPVWQLDGSRAFAAMSRSQRWWAVLTIGLAWRVSGEGLLVLLLIVAAGRALFETTAPEDGDRGTLGRFIVLIVALTLLSRRHAPV